MSGTTLPILMPALTSQRFSCHACTHCCRDLVVHLTAQDRRKLDEQNWTARLGRPVYTRLGRFWVLSHDQNRNCVFLQHDGRCRIHAELGAAAKPIGCQLFPFVILPTSRGWQLGFRFDCPTLAAAQGAPLTSHLPELNRLAGQLPISKKIDERVEFTWGRFMSESEVEAMIRHLDRWLSHGSIPYHKKIQGLVHLVETFSQINSRKVRDERFLELVELLFDALGGELEHRSVGSGPADQRMPSARQLKIFRQQVFAHLESLRFEQAAAQRWWSLPVRLLDQYRRMKKFQQPDGAARTQIISDCEIPFSDIDLIVPATRDQKIVEELIVRYLRAQILSRSFFGQGYYGWPMLIGLKALLSRLAVWGFLARYCAVGKTHEISQDDAIRAIGLISRAAGISKALGGRTEQWRLAYLSLGQGLERLIHRYSMIGHPST